MYVCVFNIQSLVTLSIMHEHANLFFNSQAESKLKSGSDNTTTATGYSSNRLQQQQQQQYNNNNWSWGARLLNRSWSGTTKGGTKEQN